MLFPKKSGEEKQLIWSKMGLPTCHPIVFFAICNGASSDPELETAKREFLQSEVVVKKSSRIFVPKLVERYANQISMSCENLLAWVRENASKKQQDAIRRCVDSSITTTNPTGKTKKLKASLAGHRMAAL